MLVRIQRRNATPCVQFLGPWAKRFHGWKLALRWWNRWNQRAGNRRRNIGGNDGHWRAGEHSRYHRHRWGDRLRWQHRLRRQHQIRWRGQLRRRHRLRRRHQLRWLRQLRGHHRLRRRDQLRWRHRSRWTTGRAFPDGETGPRGGGSKGCEWRLCWLAHVWLRVQQGQPRQRCLQRLPGWHRVDDGDR